jgi:hypothetical protein
MLIIKSKWNYLQPLLTLKEQVVEVLKLILDFRPICHLNNMTSEYKMEIKLSNYTQFGKTMLELLFMYYVVCLKLNNIYI